MLDHVVANMIESDPGSSWQRLFACINMVHAERVHEGLLRRLEAARRFLDEQLDQPITLEDAARQAHLSKYHFLRLFKATYHETPGRYVRRRRLEWASRLLVRSKLPVTKVCLSVGFESLGSFSTLFRRELGETPIRFRNRYFIMPGGVVTPARLIPCCWLRRYGIEVTMT